MMNVRILLILSAIISSSAYSQVTGSWQGFYPYHKGDVRQYRSIYTGELVHTQYTDSVIVDSLSKDQFVFGRNLSGSMVPTEVRIDSLGNLYNMTFHPDYIRYKLGADSGASWRGGFLGDTTRPVTVTVQRVYVAKVFDSLTLVKVYRFEGTTSSGAPYWIGNDHLADGFGLVKEEVEPSDVYAISGAVVGGIKYGEVLSVQEPVQHPVAHDLLESYPNPFNDVAVIRYELISSTVIDLSVYDILGRVVQHLDSGWKSAGTHKATFRGNALASATYLVVLRTPPGISSRMVLLVK